MNLVEFSLIDGVVDDHSQDFDLSMPLDRDDEDDSLLVDDPTNEDDSLVVDSQEDNLPNHHLMDLTCDLRGDMYVVNSICG